MKFTVCWFSGLPFHHHASVQLVELHDNFFENARLFYRSIRVTLEGNVLHLTNVAQWHEAVFQCVAENNQGMNVSSTWVHVLNKGTFSQQQVSD